MIHRLSLSINVTMVIASLALPAAAQGSSPSRPAANPSVPGAPQPAPAVTTAPAVVPPAPQNSQPVNAVPMQPGAQVPPGYVVIDPQTGRPMAPLPTVEKPQTLSYHEGMKAPRGYTLEESHYNGLIIGGIIPLSVLYVISFGVASGQQFKGRDGWLAVPVVGPFGWLATQRKDTCAYDYCYHEDDNAERAVVMMDGIFQAATAAMFVTGLTLTRKQWVLTEPDQIYVVPYASSTAQGLSLLGRF